MSKEPGDRHIFFNYDEYPDKLMQEWVGADPSARTVDIRLIFDVHGRMRRLMKEAEAHLTKIEQMQEQEGEPIDFPIVPFRNPVL